MSQERDPLGDAIKGQSDALRSAEEETNQDRKRMYLALAATFTPIIAAILASMSGSL